MAVVGLAAAEASEGPGAGAARLIGRDQGEGAGEGVGVVGVAAGDAVEDAQLEPDVGLAQRVSSGQLSGCAQVQLDPPVDPAGQLGCCCGLDEEAGVVGVAERGGVGDAVPQVERPGEMSLRFGGGAGGDGLPARRDGGGQGALERCGRTTSGRRSCPSRSGLCTSRPAARRACSRVRSPGTSSS